MYGRVGDPDAMYGCMGRGVVGSSDGDGDFIAVGLGLSGLLEGEEWGF